MEAWHAFLDSTLERKLKSAFIWRSDWRPHNGGMSTSSSLRIHASALALLALLGCALVTAPASASPPVDHERARRAVQSGAILPLPVVLERLAREHPGQVMEVELEEDHGQWIYEIKLLNTSGQLSKLKLDARSAAILRMKPADARSGQAAPR